MTNSLQLRIAAFGLVAGALCFTLGDTLRRVVDSSTSGSAVDLAASVHDRPGTWLAAGVLSALAPLFFLPGVHALVATTRGRGSRVVGIGGALVSIGLVASVGHAVAFYAPPALYGRADTSASAIKALDKASEGYPLLVALIVAFIVGMTIGVLVLLVGLRRAGRVPVWSVVAGLVFAVAGSSGGVTMGLVGALAGLAAFVPAARALTSTTAGLGSDARHDRAEQRAHA
jgi:hypothetical protein